MPSLRRMHISTAAVAAVVLGSTLAACGSSGSTSSHGSTISANYLQSGTYNAAAAALVPEFEKNTGITVKLYAYPEATLADDNLDAAISGRCTYNVISGSYYLASIYPEMKDLDALAAKSNYASQLIPGLWEHSEFYDGYHIGLPYGPDAYAPMYRTDLFREAGLSAPKTWSALLADLPILKAKFSHEGIEPIVFGAGSTDEIHHLLYLTYDGYMINSKGQYALDPADAVTALEYAKALLSYAPSDISGMSEEAADDTFVSGKAAILIDWPSFIQTEANAADSPIKGKWAVLPDPPDSFVYLSLWQMYMNSCTKDSEAAWKWMTTFSSASTDKVLFEKYGVNPSFKSTYDDPTIKAEYSYYLPAEEANIARAKNPPFSDQAEDIIDDEVADFVTGKASAAGAVDAMNKQLATVTVPSVLLAEARENGLVEK